MDVYMYIYIFKFKTIICVYINIYTFIQYVLAYVASNVLTSTQKRRFWDLHPMKEFEVWVSTPCCCRHTKLAQDLGFFPVSETVSCHQSSRKNTGADMIDKWLTIKFKSHDSSAWANRNTDVRSSCSTTAWSFSDLLSTPGGNGEDALDTLWPLGISNQDSVQFS